MCCNALLSDTKQAMAAGLDQKLWRSACYKIIEQLRDLSSDQGMVLIGFCVLLKGELSPNLLSEMTPPGIEVLIKLTVLFLPYILCVPVHVRKFWAAAHKEKSWHMRN